jgi:hypothetical protein
MISPTAPATSTSALISFRRLSIGCSFDQPRTNSAGSDAEGPAHEPAAHRSGHGGVAESSSRVEAHGAVVRRWRLAMNSAGD